MKRISDAFVVLLSLKKDNKKKELRRKSSEQIKSENTKRNSFSAFHDFFLSSFPLSCCIIIFYAASNCIMHSDFFIFVFLSVFNSKHNLERIENAKNKRKKRRLHKSAINL